jgi:uncharacterized protein (DUF2252 family)
MWETCSFQLKVQLPSDMAAHVEEVQKRDPDFFSRIVLYGLTRRWIYHQLREQTETRLRGDPLSGPSPQVRI